MKFQSVWQNGDAVKYPALEEDIERDIAVVGGGIAGYLTAYKLAQEGRKVTLVEADRLFSGTTGRTTAKITCNQGNVYADIASRYGRKTAELYYRSQVDAMEQYARLVKKYKIDCDWREVDSYIFSNSKSGKLKRTYEVLRESGAECELCGGAPPFEADTALKISGQYLFDPLKFLSALPVGFEIFENTRAVDIDAGKKIIQTPSGNIRAKTIVVATHFPIINSVGAYYFRLRQSTSYTVAFGGDIARAMYLDEKDNGLSLRPYEGGMLLGGGDHRTGRAKTDGHFEMLTERAKELGAKSVTHCWSAEDVMTFDSVPMAGKYVKSSDGVYVITGFNKWGMTNAMISAEIVTDMIIGRENPYAALFSPQRRISGNFKDFMSNAMTNAKEIFLGYFRLTFRGADEIPAGSGKVVRYKGKKRAVYRGTDGKLYIIGSMCPHLHGELKWNSDTKSWDCPCHGSRFDIHGNILSEPSTKRCKCEEVESKKQ